MASPTKRRAKNGAKRKLHLGRGTILTIVAANLFNYFLKLSNLKLRFLQLVQYILMNFHRTLACLRFGLHRQLPFAFLSVQLGMHVLRSGIIKSCQQFSLNYIFHFPSPNLFFMAQFHKSQILYSYVGSYFSQLQKEEKPNDYQTSY